eukprot:14233-Pelagococcus_subviridis.AAC.2
MSSYLILSTFDVDADAASRSPRDDADDDASSFGSLETTGVDPPLDKPTADATSRAGRMLCAALPFCSLSLNAHIPTSPPAHPPVKASRLGYFLASSFTNFPFPTYTVSRFASSPLAALTAAAARPRAMRGVREGRKEMDGETSVAIVDVSTSPRACELWSRGMG